VTLQPQQAVSLFDNQGRDLGRVVIDRIEGDLVFADFTPGPDYPAAERLFAEYAEAANEQLLGVVGDLDAAIATLGLHLCSPDHPRLPTIYDVQIADGGINFRIHAQPTDSRQQDAAGASYPTAPVVRSGVPAS
jgi:hypothetical protein